MSLQNAQPRFGYDAAENTIFDYLTSKSVKVGEPFESVDGVWDSIKLRDLIKTGQSIEGARVRDKVQQADADFDAELAANKQRQEFLDAERERLRAEDRSQEEEMARRDAEFVAQRQREAEERSRQELANDINSAKVGAEGEQFNAETTGTGNAGGQQQEAPRTGE